MRHILDILGYTVILIKLLVWIVLPTELETQSLPTRDTDYSFGIDQRSVFYDNNRIPDGLEVSPYLFVNTTKKFFFLVEHEIARLEITVSPCASSVRWQVTVRQGHSRQPTYGFDTALERVIGIQTLVNTKDVLFTFSGEIAETLRLDRPVKGIYYVDVTPSRSDSYVKLFATTSPSLDSYPELPLDNNISKLGVSQRSIVVAWKPSTDERHFGNDIEYCVAVNRKRNYKTLCSLLAHVEGDAKPTLPPDSGFGFRSEVFKKRYIKQRAKPIKAERRGSIQFECIGRETRFVYNRVKSGKRYYIDVYVRNKRTQRSSRYKGISVQTARKRKISILKDGKYKTVVFRKRKPVRAYIFKVKKAAKLLNLAVYSCSGYMYVEFKNKNTTFHKSKVKGLQTMTLHNVPQGTYILKLSKSVRRRQRVYVVASTKTKRFRTPNLPDDTSVRVFDYLTSCNSITVAWMGTDAKQQYCLYKTEIQNSAKATFYKKLNQCGATNRRKRAQKILCKKFRSSNKEQAVLAVTVTGLRPGSSYIFDVFVNKGNTISVPYSSVRTDTKYSCVLPT